MEQAVRLKLVAWAEKYNDRQYFTTDPINFPRRFAEAMAGGIAGGHVSGAAGVAATGSAGVATVSAGVATGVAGVAAGSATGSALGSAGIATGVTTGSARLEDVEIAGIFAAHLAWGRRSMIVNDCTRLFDEMHWKPYDYIMNGVWRCESVSVHRTIKWSEIAAICARLKEIYSGTTSIEPMSVAQIRRDIFAAKEDPHAANKKINMFRRWMVRDDGKVDLGVWHNVSKKDLLIPLDVHVFNSATYLGLTSRKSADFKTVTEITDAFREIFPEDPCLGDFALFGHGVTGGK